jgi:conflict system STAND superfamily ATPase
VTTSWASMWSSPFKGQLSFQIEDEAIFFGRDTDAQALARRVLSSSLTVLHAPSGAGKTSLLNARIIPMLERAGWMVVRARPEDHPSRALRTAVLQYIFPHPESEAIVLGRACEQLKVRPTASLGELVKKFEDVPRGHPLRQIAAAPVQKEESDALQGVRPLTCRLLSQMADEMAVKRQWAVTLDPSKYPSDDRVAELPSQIDGLRTLLGGAVARAGYDTLQSVVSPLSGLLAFFRNLTPWCTLLRPDSRMVLILDQFEEVFTRFRDPGRLHLHMEKLDESTSVEARQRPRADWRLRREFFTELEELYRGQTASPGYGTDEPDPLIDVRLVISLRDEYVARLGPIRRFTKRSSEDAFRLEFLSADQTRDALQGPAQLRQRTVTKECCDLVLKGLQLEDEFVEPGPLQIVCEHLWAYGSGPVIDADALTDPLVGGVAGVLATYFRSTIEEIVKTLTRDDVGWRENYIRFEILDLLNLLVTPSGTRNVVEKRLLVNVEYRSPDRRETLLNALEELRIVRKEVRFDEEFYEITHEFLIDPVRQTLRGAERFGEIVRAVEGLRHALEYPFDVMDQAVFRLLDEYCDLFVWDARSTEVMLRNALAHGARDKRDAVGFWASRFAQLKALPRLEDVLKRKTLGLLDSRVILSGADLSKEMPPEQTARLLRALIVSSGVDSPEPFKALMSGRRPHVVAQ